MLVPSMRLSPSRKYCAELLDIRSALAQQWQPDGEYIEPVIEVLTQLAFATNLLRLAVGGGDHAHVRRGFCRGAADARSSEFVSRTRSSFTCSSIGISVI